MSPLRPGVSHARPASPTCANLIGVPGGRRGGVIGVLAVVGFVALLAAGAVGALDGARSTGAGDPVGDLVDAWARSRTATYRATGTTTRTAADGTSLTALSEVVQRPPDRLVRNLGAVTGRRGDRVLVCPDPTASSAEGGTCALGLPGQGFDVVVEAEVTAFAALVTGPDPLYEVRGREGSCWRLRRTRYDPRAGFGVRTDLCVDPTTGAVASIRTDHGSVVEETVHDRITAVVADADLEP